MQDTRTGAMLPLNQKFFEGAETLSPFERRQRMQHACDAAQPDRTRQGPVFCVGEVVELRGGKFKVAQIKRGRLVLKGVPS